MHGDVGPPLCQGVLQLLHEQAFATDLGQRCRKLLVPFRGHTQNLNLEFWMQHGESVTDVMRLPQCEGGTPCTYSECHGSPSIMNR